MPLLQLVAALAFTQTHRPVDVEVVAGHIYLPVTVNGKPAKFILDTGAQSSVVLPESAERLGVTGGTPVQARGAGNEAVSAKITKIANISAGGQEVQNMTAIVLALPSGIQCDGILGAGFLKNFVTTIDYEHKKVTFTPKEDFKVPNGAVEIPIKMPGGVPQAEVTIAGLKGWATIDTGANGTLTLNTPFVIENKLRDQFPRRIKTIVGKGVGGFVYGELFKLDSFEFGPFKMPTLIAAMADQKGGVFSQKDLVANIGSDVLSRFTVSFDYPGLKMVLQKAKRFDDESDSNRTGIVLDFDGQHEMVADVAPGSPGARSGVETGDEIVEYNGRPIQEFNAAQIREVVRQKAGTKVSFKIKKKSGELVTVNLTLEDWIK